jgi:hypothetical protein
MSDENVTVTEVPEVPVDFQAQAVQNQFEASTEAPVDTPAPTLGDLIAAGELLNIPITNENVSLNVIVAFLNQASRRGAFSIEENAKIWECIKFFVQPSKEPSA